MSGAALVFGGWGLIFILLAGYGALALVLHMTRLVRRALVRPATGSSPLSVVVLVRDQEQLIEGFLRTLTGMMSTSSGEVIVMDTGSSDDTLRIVERLARRPGCLRLLRRAVPMWLHELSCQTRVAVLVDLQGAVAVRQVLDTVELLLGETKWHQQRLRSGRVDT